MMTYEGRIDAFTLMSRDDDRLCGKVKDGIRLRFRGQKANEYILKRNCRIPNR